MTKKSISIPSENVLPLGLTEQRINELKQEHGPIDLIKVVDKKDSKIVYHCVVKQPGKRVIAIALKFVDKDPFKACEVMLKECFIMGDTEILEQAPYIILAGGKLLEKVDQAEADLINL